MGGRGQKRRQAGRQAGRLAGWLLLLKKKNNSVVIQCISLGIQWVFFSLLCIFLSFLPQSLCNRNTASEISALAVSMGTATVRSSHLTSNHGRQRG